MIKRCSSTALLLVMLLPILQACSTPDNELDFDPDDDLLMDEPIQTDTGQSSKLLIRWYGNHANELQYDPDNYFAKIEQRFPNIEFERHEESTRNTRQESMGSDPPWPIDTLTEMMSAKQEPDIIIAYTELIPTLSELGLLTDMEQYASSNQLDLTRFEPAFLNQVRSYSPDGQLLAVPYMRTLHAMSYNKSLFDAARIPYPTDGMTWEQWIPWTARIEGALTDNQTIGLSFGFGYPLLAFQRSAPILDVDTGKANVNNESWKAIARILQHYPNYSHSLFDLYNFVTGFGSSLHRLNAWYDTEPAAIKFIHSAVGQNFSDNSDWDMVSFPTFESTPGIGPDFVGEVLSVNPKSEHREEAFEVLSYLISDEFQTWNARLGNGSPLNNPSINAQFGAENEYYQGKNVAAFFSNKPAEPVRKNAREPQAEHLIGSLIDEFNRSSDPQVVLQRFEEQWNIEE